MKLNNKLQLFKLLVQLQLWVLDYAVMKTPKQPR